MNDQPSTGDKAVMASLLSILAGGVLALLTSENFKTQPDPSRWYHWAFCVLGVILVIISCLKFLMPLVTGCMYNHNDVGIFNIGFRNSTRLMNWVLTFVIGLFIVVYELNIEVAYALAGHN